MHQLEDRLKQARELSWAHLGKKITFYLPGMFRLNGHTGRYPAVSITGGECALKCDHCQGKILASMVSAPGAEKLISKCRELAERGHLGVLISGGCLEDGSIPWQDFIPAIETIKQTTDLFVSVHCGLVNKATAIQLKQAGVDQALIDVIGDDATFQKIYHVPFGVERIVSAMDALAAADLPMVPHIVCGIDYGQIKSEYKAVEMISRFDIAQLVIVALMRLPGTPMIQAICPSVEQIADILIQARLQMPDTPISLGCARQRGNSRLEELAIDAGVNRMALPSEEAIARARAYGLDITFQPTCCSVSNRFITESWYE
ncbi:MAG: radical SAM protein [Pseudomonadota bacterium]